MGVQIVVQKKISRKSSHNLVLDILRYNTLSNNFPNKSDSAVIRKFNILSKELGLLGDFDYFVEKCRDYSTSAPFENLADSGIWTAEGGTLSVTDKITGETHGDYDAIAINAYQGLFGESMELFKASLAENTYSLFRSSIVSGVSSIEAFIRQQAKYYNKINPQEPLLDDFNSKISFYDKFNIWLPKMTGNHFDKSGREWEALKKIITFRDNEVVHPKGTYGYNYDEIIALINLYKYGIPGILRQLHVLFKMTIPSNIIRACYYPEVSLVRNI